MVDAEKVKAWLRICGNIKRLTLGCNECPYLNEVLCVSSLASDATELIALLEERIAIMQESMETLEKRCNALDALEQRCKELEQRNEPMKPTLNESHSYVSDAFKCGKCGHTIRFHAKYCAECGQAVKWE